MTPFGHKTALRKNPGRWLLTGCPALCLRKQGGSTSLFSPATRKEPLMGLLSGKNQTSWTVRGGGTPASWLENVTAGKRHRLGRLPGWTWLDPENGQKMPKSKSKPKPIQPKFWGEPPKKSPRRPFFDHFSPFFRAFFLVVRTKHFSVQPGFDLKPLDSRQGDP